MPILREHRDTVALLTMSRPEARNCWGPDFFAQLVEHLNELAEDDGVNCVVLTGDQAGQAFSAGANLKDPNAHATKSAGEFIKGLPKRPQQSFPILLSDFPKPILAAVNGYAIGAGCIMACSCDLVIASDRAEWRLPQASLGIMPQHAATVRLARWIGKANAMKLALGFPLKAEEGYRVGLAQWLVGHDTLLDEAMALANRISVLPPLAVRMIKESMNRGIEMANVADSALIDNYRAMALGLTADSEESHAAWRERRAPKIEGR